MPRVLGQPVGCFSLFFCIIGLIVVFSSTWILFHIEGQCLPTLGLGRSVPNREEEQELGPDTRFQETVVRNCTLSPSPCLCDYRTQDSSSPEAKDDVAPSVEPSPIRTIGVADLQQLIELRKAPQHKVHALLS